MKAQPFLPHNSYGQQMTPFVFFQLLLINFKIELAINGNRFVMTWLELDNITLKLYVNKIIVCK